MQTTEYDVWNWQEVYNQNGITIYANDYMVCVKFDVQNNFLKNTLARIGTFTIPSDYTPLQEFYIPTNYRYLNIGIYKNGALYYQNTATYDINGTANAIMVYPRKNALP